MTNKFNRTNNDISVVVSAAIDNSYILKQGNRNAAAHHTSSKQSSSVVVNPTDFKGMKVQSPFSPTTYTRLVDIQTKAKKFEETFSGIRSRAQMHK